MSKKSFRYIIFVGVIFLLLWTLAPLYVVFISSITPDKDLLNVPPTWIPRPDLSNYAYALTSGEEGGTAWLFRKSLVNSFIVAASVTVFCLFVGGLAGYAFSRFALPFKDKLLFLVLFTQMLPVITVVIPLYLIFSTLHMLDRLITLVIVYSSFTLPLVIWLLKGFFDTIPADLEEAAMVDGSTLLGAFFRIVVPLSIPGVIATGGLAFLAAWNEFMIVLVFTNTAASKTMPVAVAEFIGRFRVDYGLMCSVGIIASLLPVALALVFQKYLVQGLSAGGVKG